MSYKEPTEELRLRLSVHPPAEVQDFHEYGPSSTCDDKSWRSYRFGAGGLILKHTSKPPPSHVHPSCFQKASPCLASAIAWRRP